MINEKVFLTPFFLTLNRFDIGYAVLRNYSGLPDSLGGSDLDILILEDDAEKFYNIFYKVLIDTNGYVIAKSRGKVPKICVLGGYKNKYYGIMIDVHQGIIPYKTEDILPVKFIFSRIKDFKNIKVLDENDANFIGFLKEIFYNKHCEKYFKKAKTAWSINKDVYIKELTQIYSDQFIGQLDNVLTDSQYNQFKVKKLAIKGSNEITFGVTKKLKLFGLFIGKMYRFFKPFGYTVAFLGVDGAGKTTIINKISPLLKKAVHNELKYEHLRPNYLPSIAFLFGKNKPLGPVTDPHQKAPSGFIGSIFRITYYSIDYIIGFWLKIYPSIVKKPTLWIFDRYFYDYLIDQKRGRIKLPIWVIKLFEIFIPSPNLIICLGGDPKIIFNRKKEIPIKEVRAQVKSLKLFSERKKNAFWIDTNNDISSTTNEVIELIKISMNKRLKQ